MDSSSSRPVPLVFRPATPGSIGIEIELPILDRDTGELVPGAQRILEACKAESIPGVDAELMQSMLELRAGPCDSVTDLRRQLVPPLRRVRTVARARGYEFALLGTHPSQRTSQHTVFPESRFEDARIRLAWMVYYRVAFGLHIHVGMGGSEQALGVLNRAVPYLAHMVALSANSPYWQGVDTGLASSRVALYGLVPHAGVPPPLERWKDFRGYFQVMCDCGAATSLKDIKWDVRPRPDLGTLEFRICDMPHSLERIFSVAAFIRSLCLTAMRLLDERPRARRTDAPRQWITVENRWLAARYGLDAVYIRSPDGKRRPLLDDLKDTIGKIQEVAKESGDDRFLAPLRSTQRLESGAARQRQTYKETGDWTAMMKGLIRQFNQELDAVTTNGKPAHATSEAPQSSA